MASDRTNPFGQRAPHPATVVQRSAIHPAQVVSAPPPHAATVVQRRAPHPAQATAQAPAPHPAQMALRRPPHAATVAQRLVAQRTDVKVAIAPAAVNDATGRLARDNCALCTVAAILGTTSGGIANQCGSGEQDEKAFIRYLLVAHPEARQGLEKEYKDEKLDLKAESKQGDNLMLTAQILGMFDFLQAKGKNPYTACDIGKFVQWGPAKAFMDRQPAGTQFAVYCNGLDTDDGMAGHWFYGVKEDEVLFKDFQTNVSGKPARESKRPLAPKNRYFETSVENGGMNKYFVIAVA